MPTIDRLNVAKRTVLSRAIQPLRVLLPLLCFTMPLATSAQTPIGCNTGWATIQRITGSFQLTGSGTETLDDGLGATTTNTVQQSISGTVDMTASGLPMPGGGTCYFGLWNGSSTILVNLNNKSVYNDPATGTTDTTEFSVSGGQNILSTTSSPSLLANPLNGTLRLSTASFTGADTGLVNTTETLTDAGVVTSLQTQTLWGPIMTTAVPAQGTFLTVPLPSAVGPVTGSTSFQAGVGGLTGLANWTLTWNFAPATAQFDLVVNIPAYPTWRPTGGKNEQDIGSDPATGLPNTLEIDAQLMDKSTGEIAYPDTLTFSLLKVSQEPGVTLNWPPSGQAQNNLDLTFDAAVNPLAQVSSDGTSAVLNTGPDHVFPTSGVLLSPHDWGGWATLNVTATVDGIQVQGHLPGDSNNDIRLPKRQVGSLIADSWKDDHDIPLGTPDDDDSEKSPDNNPNSGDGLTLYEEYRGFYVHCAIGINCVGGLLHREGDPHTKDLFVVNDMGPDVVAGINLFAAGSGVKVCCATLRDDLVTPDHIINFNHSQAPHEIDQHAVVIVKGNADAAPCTQGGPAQPKNISKIYFPPMGNILAQALQEGGTARFQWANLAYPSEVAHELGHSVDIWHHGDNDTGKVTWTTADGTALAELAADGTSTPIQVLLEDSTPVNAADLQLSTGQSLTLWQGITGGQHSGDVFCFMRYSVSQQYIPSGNLRYYVPEREGPGMILTDLKNGTGTNQSGRKPQSRYGDASRGNCLFQLCVNDSLSPVAQGTPSQEPCPGQN
jgi:hypothetical protein